MFYQNGSEKARLDSSGNLGLGESSPESILHIKKAASGSSYSADGGDLLIIENNSSAGIDFRTPTGDAGAIYFSDTTRARGAIIYYHSLDDMYFNVAGTSGAMILDSTGTLSITHSATAHTNGLDIINSQAGGYGSAVNFQSERSDNNAIATAARIRTEGAEAWNAADAVSSAVVFENVFNGTLSEYMRVSSAGNLAINTTTATTNFNVQGDSTGDIVTIRTGSTADSNVGAILFRDGGADGDGDGKSEIDVDGDDGGVDANLMAR